MSKDVKAVDDRPKWNDQARIYYEAYSKNAECDPFDELDDIEIAAIINGLKAIYADWGADADDHGPIPE